MIMPITKKPQETPTIAKHFAKLSDPRKGTLRYHNFMDIIVIGICAVICGADDYEAMAEFGRSKKEWLGTFLELPNGIPAHDTFWRVFEALNPEQFQQCFLEWMAGVRKTKYSKESSLIIEIEARSLADFGSSASSRLGYAAYREIRLTD